MRCLPSLSYADCSVFAQGHSLQSAHSRTTFDSFFVFVNQSMESHFGQKRSRFSSDGRDFPRTVEISLGRSRFPSDGRDFTRTVEILLGRSRFYSDGRDFTRTVEILLGRSKFYSDGRDFKFSRTVENTLSPDVI